PNEGELTYENLQVSRDLQKEVAECGPLKSVPELPCWATSCHCWRPDLQASRQLQEASSEHAAKSHVLGERTHHLQAGLEDSQYLLRLTKQQLNSTMVALRQSQAAENQTRRQLQQQELQANHSLALLRRERESLVTNLTQATSCQQIGCCPHGWTLFRWKCLWASSEKKTWGASNRDCEWRSSRLLVLPEPWSARELWEAVGKAFTEALDGPLRHSLDRKRPDVGEQTDPDCPEMRLMLAPSSRG
ncbi:hypothetical protein E2320_017962, partial [Naja naja]